MSRVVVVGAGMAGLRAAEQLRASGWTQEILVLGQEPHAPYNRPPLSKEALSGMGAEDPQTWADKLAFRQRPSVADVEWRLGTEAVGADLEARRVTCADGTEVEYDGLVIASGIRSRRLSIDGPAEGRFTLRTLADAVALQRTLLPGARVVVVGGGFIGCEVAATATAMGCRVTVVEPLPGCLQRGLGDLVGGLVQSYLSGYGIRMLTGRTVRELLPLPGRPGRVGSVVLDDDMVLPADVVVGAVGSTPNVEWLAGNGLDLTDGVLCDERLRAAGRDDVVAVGDVARFVNPRFDDVARRVEHWCIPTDTARFAAGSLVRALHDLPDDRPPFAPMPSFWSDQLELRIQSFGAPGLADEVTVVDGNPDPCALTEGLIAHYRRGGRLVGVVLVNAPANRHREQRELVSASCPG